MSESEILQNAMSVCKRLRKYGFSRYAVTRPVSIISGAIMEAKKAHFEESALIEYVTNRVLLLSSKEIGREIKKEDIEQREELKKGIHKDVKKLVKSMYDYHKQCGFKEFILLTRYLSDAVYVETKFGGAQE